MNIIEAAKEAGFRERHGLIRVQHSNGSFVIVDEQLSRFAAIIRAQALEDAKQAVDSEKLTDPQDSSDDAYNAAVYDCVYTIKSLISKP